MRLLSVYVTDTRSATAEFLGKVEFQEKRLASEGKFQELVGGDEASGRFHARGEPDGAVPPDFG